MNTIVIALLSACVIGASLAQDCSSQVKAFHQCLEAQHNQPQQANKPKWEALKAQAAACYTSNGCPAPSPKKEDKGPRKGGKGGAHGNRTSIDNSAREQCREALEKKAEQQILACVHQANPGVSLPAHQGGNKGEGHGHRGGPHRNGGDEEKHGNFSSTCPDQQKEAAVRQCLRKLYNSSAPSDAQKEQAFNAQCQAKKTCQAKLSAQCQQQLANVKKSFCQCAQQQFQPAQLEKLRSGTPACQGVQQQTPKPQAQAQAQGRGQHKAKSCDEVKPDYCELGYQQFKAAEEKEKAQHQVQWQAKGQAQKN